jgi:hypothetical protein
MNDSIPELKIERMDDEHGTLILLEQDSGGNVDRVCLHPIHLRYMAEKFGLVPTSDPEGAKTIAALQRRLCLLRDRLDHLGHYLTNHSDRDRANLDFEISYAEATSDMADEFCADFVREGVAE